MVQFRQRHADIANSLLFTVWYRSYCDRFAALPSEFRALSYVPDPYRPQIGSRTSSMRTTSIKGREPGFWDKLMGKRESRDIEKGNGGEWDDVGEDGLALESSKKELLDEDIKDESANSEILNAAIIQRGVDGDTIESLVQDSPKSDLVSSDSSNPASSVQATKSLEFSKPPLERVATNLSTFSSTDSENLEKKRFPNLRFANLAPLISRTSREKELPADTPLPFIDEISLVVTTFILPGSSRELNLDDRLRKHILKYLQPIDENGNKLPPSTTHPDVFIDASEHSFDLMERSLPKYLSYAKGNTNAPKTLFW